MSTPNVQTIAILGAGQMGGGIAHVSAAGAYTVLLSDVTLERAEKGRFDIELRLGKAVEKGKLTAGQRAEILGRITPVEGLSRFAEADFVIEAANENEALKKSLFRQFDELCRPDIVLATNTSSIPITRIAAVTRRPERVIGMHFMNPVPVMKLVEIIRGLATSDATHETTLQVCARLDKTTVTSRDIGGFIVNRVLMPMINEAIYALYEGIGTATDIDTGMKLGTNQPMGPLELADFIGLDTCLAIMEVLQAGLGDSKYRPCPLLRQYVEAGWLGRKTGRGFHIYAKS
ncbi:MAG: 3-hydroxybutyryl-CoA dehydrogenase [Myxococcales bacterium]|nr:3-hydroxybutyryl-CoA dehydrogenase [Myxococcales bacterium]